MNRWIDRFIALAARWAWNSTRRRPLSLSAEDMRAARLSFSQHGEDLLLFEHLFWLRRKQRGIYIDAGCYDPFEFSNTRLLYLSGWRGINIDAAPDVISKFQKWRPDDHNVCAALAGEHREVVLCGRPGAATRHILPAQPATETSQKIMTLTLEDIWNASPYKASPVDLLDIDCENQDLAILRSFPFSRVRPALICIEAHGAEELSKISEFLLPRDYFRVGTRGPSHIFRDRHTVPPDAPPHTRFSEICQS